MQHTASRDDILHAIQAAMKELFDLDASRVHPGARLVEDLDLDSIDALDLAAKMEQATGRAFDGPSLRKMRTIQDVISAIQVVVEDGAHRKRTSA